MAGVVGQAGVVDPIDGRMGGEGFGNLLGAAVLVTNAQGQGFHPPVQEKTGVGIQAPAQVNQLVGDFFQERLRADDRPGHDIRMAVKIFGAAVPRKMS